MSETTKSVAGSHSPCDCRAEASSSSQRASAHSCLHQMTKSQARFEGCRRFIEKRLNNPKSNERYAAQILAKMTKDMLEEQGIRVKAVRK